MDINRAGRVLLVRTGEKQQQQQQQQHDGNIPSGTLRTEEGDEKVKEQQHNRHRGPVALSVWPHVLSRLTRKRRYPNVVPTKNGVNGVYYLIRHGPIFMQQIANRVPTHNNNNNNDNNSTTNGNTTKAVHGTNEDEDDDGGSGRRQYNTTSNVVQPKYRKRKRGDPALGGYTSLEEFLRHEAGVTA
jgi:hypothetical protein